MRPRLVRFMLLTLVLSTGCWIICLRSSAAFMPLEIKGGEAQLFVDDYLIASETNVKRTLHQPKKDDGGNVPVIALDKEVGEVGATLEANGTIVYDPRLRKYVMFAIGFWPSLSGSERVRLFRFTSADAMNWVKGDDGTPQRIHFDLKDAASGQSATNIDLFSCFYDTTDVDYPYKGWLYFSNWGDLEGVYYVRSKDGRTWERGRMIARGNIRKIQQDGRFLEGPGDVTTFYHDAVSNRFLGLIKFTTPKEVEHKSRLRSRAYAFFNKLDEPFDMNAIKRVELVPPAAEVNGDMPHDEYYASTAWRYESLWLGGLKVWHGGGDHSYSAAGSAFYKLAVSRDGVHWKKVQFPNDSGVPEVFIANGPEGGSNGRNDGGYMTEFSQGPLRIGNELIYYYGSSSYGKNHAKNIRVTGGGIFRARLRPDGFVSVDGGTLVTKPLKFKGQELLINGIGPISVEVLDTDGKSLAVETVKGDSLQHRIRFKGKSLGLIAKKGVAQLRFTVEEGGQLYSFTVR